MRLLLFILVILFALPVHAQEDAPGIERILSITSNPTYPAPNERIRLSIGGYAVDIDRSIVVWYVDNKEVSRGPGLRDLELDVGALGSVQRIRVFAEEPSGIIAIGEAEIRPTEVTLLWETDSYTPPFYRGRALAGSNSTINAQALANLRRGTATISNNNIVYSWYRNGALFASGLGRSAVSFPGPRVFETHRIEVVAESVQGDLAGRAEMILQGSDPQLELYEHHPLFGTLYHRAFVGTVLTGEDEQKVAAVPFFAPTEPHNPSLVYNWSAAGRVVPPDSATPDIITLRRGPGFTGTGEVALSLTSTSDIFLSARNMWTITFGDQTTFQNPFVTP